MQLLPRILKYFQYFVCNVKLLLLIIYVFKKRQFLNCIEIIDIDINVIKNKNLLVKSLQNIICGELGHEINIEIEITLFLRCEINVG